MSEETSRVLALFPNPYLLRGLVRGLLRGLCYSDAKGCCSSQRGGGGEVPYLAKG